MIFLLKPKWRAGIINARNRNRIPVSFYGAMPHDPRPTVFEGLCKVVTCSVGCLDELESSLDRFRPSLSSSLVSQVVDSCKHGAPSRRLLRFFLWSHKNLNSHLEDKDFNHVIRVMADKKDQTAMEILISNLRKDDRVMECQTFSLVAETLVNLGREDEALGIFKMLDKFKCPQDGFIVNAIVMALCAKGQAKKAEGVVYHHKDKISGMESCIYRSLLHGWSLQGRVKEARKVIKEMKSVGIMPDLFCYNTFLRCLCEKNLKHNPSGLVPEAINVMMEMRSYKIAPTSISYNILLSCLGKTRRVSESCRILELMKRSGCSPDWVSYYLVARVLYLSGRFGKGNKVVDEMIERGLTPDHKFYYDLIGILCGVERVIFALELFQQMKRSLLGGYGPIYDVIIPKLCKGGDFEKGRELWGEAVAMGVALNCTSDVLDPSKTEVFKPRVMKEEANTIGSTASRSPKNVKKYARKDKKEWKKPTRKKKSTSK